MHVSGIHTYPIKGCYRVDQDRAEVQPWGLRDDRRWMIVDAATGQAMTQRVLPALTRLRPRVVAGGLVVSTPGFDDLVVVEPGSGETVDVSLWAYTGQAAAAGTGADEWLSDALAGKVRLVWLDDPTRRRLEPGYSEPTDRVSFADGYPVLLANTASLAALNDLIAESGSWEGPLPMTRFRPNIVVSAAPAWAEDGWLGGRIRIGPVTFRVAKACARCVVTTTDQDTGERGREPLRTLARHRNVNNGLQFASNLIPDGTGVIALGDPVIPV
jgi:uncharacterized protein YcbX